MTQVRVHEVVATMRVVDGESLLSPQLMERIVSTVLQAMNGEKRDQASRQHDTHIGAPGYDGRQRGDGSEGDL